MGGLSGGLGVVGKGPVRGPRGSWFEHDECHAATGNAPHVIFL